MISLIRRFRAISISGIWRFWAGAFSFLCLGIQCQWMRVFLGLRPVRSKFLFAAVIFDFLTAAACQWDTSWGASRDALIVGFVV